MENTPKKNNFFLLSAFLILVLFILPAGSWYYLKKGADFRIAHIKDMESKGDFNLSKINGITEAQKDSLAGKTIIASVNETISKEVDNQIKTLVDQFGERTDFKMIRVHNPEGEEGFQEHTTLKHLWEATQSAPENFGLNSEVEKPYWALIDNKGQIRNFYAQSDFEKLVVQTAMILPIEKRKKIDLKRDKEM